MPSMRPHNQNSGFTLVELAIVLVIVGLLIAGILKGQELIRNSYLTATVRDFQSFSAAHNTFRDIYRRMPGDMVDATEKLPDCNAANNCANGNGDGLLGVRLNNSTAATGNIENTLYWKHLAMSDMITGIDKTAGTGTSDWIFGMTHPVSKLGGGWNAIMTVRTGIGDYGGHGVILQISGTPNRNAAAISPDEAAYIDLKIDDGRPNSGSVTAEWSSTSNCDDDTTNSYLGNTVSLECVLYFDID